MTATKEAPPRLRPVDRSLATLPAVWPVYMLLYGYPLWWALGLQAFIWPILAVPMAISLLRRRTVKVPRAWGLFALFVFWMLVSGLQVESSSQILAFVYRGSLYVSAMILLVYIFNLSAEQLPTRKLVAALVFLWLITVIGGYAGLLFPAVQFSTVTELLMPQSIASDAFVRSLVHPSLAAPSRLLGYDLWRPEAPFNYTNAWGSNLGILTMLAICYLHFLRRPTHRMLVIGVLAASVVPIILSINRGLWLSLLVGTAYVAIRVATRGSFKALAALLTASALALLAVAYTPLGEVVGDRVQKENLSGRTSLYEEAGEATLSSPVLGYGAPIPRTSEGPEVSVGTHGQLWTLLVSQGIPGVLLFIGFFVATLALTRRVTGWGLWPHAAILVGLFQMPFYNMLPVQLHVLMLAALLCWRNVRNQRAGSHRAAVES